MPKPVLLSTAYFPPITWFAALIKSAVAKLETCETYTKQSYRNRCHIIGPNGLQVLTVPVNKPFGNQTKTTQITLARHSNWQRTHWRAIETAYNTSPFFLFYRDRFHEVLFADHTHLFALNQALINMILGYLGLPVEIGFTKEFEKEPQDLTDIRNIIHPKKPLPKQINFPVYTQVFNAKHDFIPNLSIIDLLFNEGPASLDYLNEVVENLCFPV